tara:strand:+ start:789 stop:956 length:168 start_codon:yes stop_codon:yes gene_type:complete
LVGGTPVGKWAKRWGDRRAGRILASVLWVFVFLGLFFGWKKLLFSGAVAKSNITA